jgi:hypothetical protein
MHSIEELSGCAPSSATAVTTALSYVRADLRFAIENFLQSTRSKSARTKLELKKTIESE